MMTGIPLLRKPSAISYARKELSVQTDIITASQERSVSTVWVFSSARTASFPAGIKAARYASVRGTRLIFFVLKGRRFSGST